MSDSNFEASPVSVSMISEYIVGKTLGQGSYGVVKQGVHWKSNELVALKIIPEKFRSALQQEIDIMKMLNHQNVVKLIEVIDIPQHQQICLVMEYMDGGDLFEHIIQKKKLSERTASKFFRQLLKALYHCHTNGVVHRDLKPENMLLDSRKHLKLTDFGLSSVIHPGVLLSANCGSALYAAPEIISKKKYIGPEVDIWSLGVVLYAMCTGCLPWAGKRKRDQMDNILIGNYVPPSGVSPSCANLISRMLTVDPRDRATLLELFLHPWVNNGHSRTIPASLPLKPFPLPRKDVDKEILEEMSEIGFSKQSVLFQLERGSEESQIEPAIAMYYLLLHYKLKAQEDSNKSDGEEKKTPTKKNSLPKYTESTKLIRHSHDVPNNSESESKNSINFRHSFQVSPTYRADVTAATTTITSASTTTTVVIPSTQKVKSLMKRLYIKISGSST